LAQLPTRRRRSWNAVRLEVANQQFQVCDNLDQAVQMSPHGRIEVIANYTAFQDLRRRVGN
jgi:hypothetical protein